MLHVVDNSVKEIIFLLDHRSSNRKNFKRFTFVILRT